METQPTITLDDKSYIIEELSEKARYCIAQIQDLQQQSSAMKGRLDQLEVANSGFMNMLKEEIEGAE